jgi:hypothetical protein
MCVVAIHRGAAWTHQKNPGHPGVTSAFVRAELRLTAGDCTGGHSCEVFSAAVVVAATVISGGPQPSQAGIKMTRDLIRAGQLLKIEKLNHIGRRPKAASAS